MNQNRPTTTASPFLPGLKPPSRYAFAQHVDTGEREYLINRPVPNTDPQPGDLQHRWADGEWLDKLAMRYFGDPTLWWIIADFNPSIDPMTVQIGAMLRIPNRRRLLLDILPRTQ